MSQRNSSRILESVAMMWGTAHRILLGGEGQRDGLLLNGAIGMPWRVLHTRETRFRSKGTSGRKRSLENPRHGPLLPILSLLSGSLFCCLTASNAWNNSLRMSSRSLAALAKLWVTTGSERWTIRVGVKIGTYIEVKLYVHCQFMVGIRVKNNYSLGVVVSATSEG